MKETIRQTIVSAAVAAAITAAAFLFMGGASRGMADYGTYVRSRCESLAKAWAPVHVKAGYSEPSEDEQWRIVDACMLKGVTH